MNQLTLEFSDWNDLQQQLAHITHSLDDKPGAALVNVNQRADGSGQMSLALFDDDELSEELQRRKGGASPLTPTGEAAAAAADAAPDAPKRSRGRPPKLKAVESAPTTPAANEEEAPAPAAEAIPAKPTEPQKEATAVAPDMPTEDSMLELMSEVYSASGDMELVRGIMKDVGEQTQLSRIPVSLWPRLRERLLKAMAELKANVA